MRNLSILIAFLVALPIAAQTDSFEKFHQQKEQQFDRFKNQRQQEFDAYRQRVNAEYAEFMRRSWREFPVQEPIRPVKEEEVPPVIYQPEPEPAPAPAPKPKEEPKVDTKPTPQPTPQPEPKPEPAPAPPTAPIAVKPTVIVMPEPEPAPAPIAPVQPKEEPFKKVSVSYFGSLVSIGFPVKEDFKLNSLSENAIADAWQQLSDSRYDITIKTVLDARDANALCDWAYMNMLREVCTKHYGNTNKAVLAQAFLMVQSGYRIRLAFTDDKLMFLIACQYTIFDMPYYTIDGIRYYEFGGNNARSMYICEAKFDAEKSLSLQIAQLPKFPWDGTQKRMLTSKKGVAAPSSVNKNFIDFLNTYPQACYKDDQSTRWAAYANTPLDKAVKDMLYAPLRKTIQGMSEREAVEILLNWVQTAFVYEYDDKVWGHDRAFLSQETLYYPYCDCEDRSILFSRIIRDLLGLDVVLLHYPGHLATAVAFSNDEAGDYLTFNKRRYTVCDPTYINAGVGRTMPSCANKKAQVIALKK